MANCNKCGAPVEEGTTLCTSCANESDFTTKISNLNNTPDTTDEFDSADINQNKAMAVLSYLSWLVLIPLFAAKDSKFARFHTNQGLVLAITEIAYGIAYSILSSIILAISWRLYFLVSILGLISFVFLILTIIGIVNAAGGKAKELPIIGKIKLLK